MNHMTASCKGDDYIILMNCTIIMSHIRKWKLSPKNIIIITMWPIKYLSKWMHLLSSDQNNLRNYGFCSSHDVDMIPDVSVHFIWLTLLP